MSPIQFARAVARRQRGAGLIEIMVAMAVGLLLVLGAVTVFMQGRTSSRTSDAMSRLQDTMKYAIDTIEPDVRMANFWGMTNRAELISNVALPAAARTATDALVSGSCGNNFTANLTQYVDGRNNGAWGLGCAAFSQAPWADVLIVRRASAGQTAISAGTLQLQTTRINATIFGDGVMPPGYAAAPRSETHDLIVNVYYVGQVFQNGVATWALRKKTLTSVGGVPTMSDVEVVRDIGDMQLQFGVDRTNDNNPDLWVNPQAPELLTGRIVAVRIYLMAMSEEAERGFVDSRTYTMADRVFRPNDNRRRLVVSKVIQLRNAVVPL